MQIFTTSEVAILLKVSPAAVSSWVDDGILIGWRLPGGGRRIGREALVDFMERFGMPLELLPPEEGEVKDEEGAAAP